MIIVVQLTAQMYHIVTPNVSGTYFNVRIQVNQSEGHAAFYCNPSWGGQPDSENHIAFAGNAVWETGIVLQAVLVGIDNDVSQGSCLHVKGSKHMSSILDCILVGKMLAKCASKAPQASSLLL